MHARYMAGALPEASIIAADPSQAMLETARNKPHGEKVQWVCASAQEPPAPPTDPNNKNAAYQLVLFLGNTLSLIESVEPVFEAIARITAPNGLLVVQMLDYEYVRKTGTQHFTKENETVSIEKLLTANPIESGGGANLALTIKSVEDGSLLAREEYKLHEHPEETWLESIEQYGWHIIERRKSYKDGDKPIDRIYVFQQS